MIGLIGGWLGGWLTRLLGLEEASGVGSLVVAFAGAYLVMLGLRKAQPDRSRGRRTASGAGARGG